MRRDQADAAIRRWFAAAVRAADPERAVASSLARRDHELAVAGHSLDVRGRLFVAAIGKAAPAMARGAAAACGELIAGGVIITKDGHLDGVVPIGFDAFETAHPIPDARCQSATEHLLARLAELGEADVVLALISGGGSALMEAPLDGVRLTDIAETTNLLLRAGAPIQDLNAIRVPLSKVKGGGLRAAAHSSRFVTMLLSDVLGNDPRVIASGPTVPTAFSGSGALAMLDRYGLRERVPNRIRIALDRAAEAPGAEMFRDDIVTLVGDNAGAVDAVAAAASADGIRARVTMESITGEARERAVEFVASALAEEGAAPVVLGGGELTVTVTGDGKGGRNTEFALAAALALERHGAANWVVASLATDGQDALTGMAGAIGSCETLARAREAGIDPERALAANDSLAVFAVAGGAVETGPTGTNVNDIFLALKTDAPGLL